MEEVEKKGTVEDSEAAAGVDEEEWGVAVDLTLAWPVVSSGSVKRCGWCGVGAGNEWRCSAGGRGSEAQILGDGNVRPCNNIFISSLCVAFCPDFVSTCIY